MVAFQETDQACSQDIDDDFAKDKEKAIWVRIVPFHRPVSLFAISDKTIITGRTKPISLFQRILPGKATAPILLMRWVKPK